VGPYAARSKGSATMEWMNPPTSVLTESPLSRALGGLPESRSGHLWRPWVHQFSLFDEIFPEVVLESRH
jgi:hypothetical protein